MSNKAGLWEAEWRTAVKKIERQDAELTKLKADVVRLRAALEPFGNISQQLHRVEDSAELYFKTPFGYCSVYVTVAQVREAAKILKTI